MSLLIFYSKAIKQTYFSSFCYKILLNSVLSSLQHYLALRPLTKIILCLLYNWLMNCWVLIKIVSSRMKLLYYSVFYTIFGIWLLLKAWLFSFIFWFFFSFLLKLCWLSAFWLIFRFSLFIKSLINCLIFNTEKIIIYSEFKK